MMGREARRWGEGLRDGWVIKPRRMTSAQEEVRGGGDAGERGVHTFKLHLLNHTLSSEALASPAQKWRPIAAGFQRQLGPVEEGGKSPYVWVSAAQGSGEEKQGKLELLLAAHSAQSPFSNPSMLAGWTVGRDTAGAQQTADPARKSDYVWVKPWLWLHKFWLMIITITGLGPRLTKKGINADLSAAKLTHASLSAVDNKSS